MTHISIVGMTNQQHATPILRTAPFADRNHDTRWGNGYGRGNIMPEYTELPAGTLTAAQKVLLLATLDSFFYASFPYELEEITDNGAPYVRIREQFYDPGWQIDPRAGAPALDPIVGQLAVGSDPSYNQAYGGHSAWYGDNDIGGSMRNAERHANQYWALRNIIKNN